MAIECTPALLAALADVCGYHEGDGCQHCAEVLRHARERQGWTDEELLADIALYESDFDAWADRVRRQRVTDNVEQNREMRQSMNADGEL